MGLKATDIPRLLALALKGQLVGFDLEHGKILVSTPSDKKAILSSEQFDVEESDVIVVGRVRALSSNGFFPRARHRPLTNGVSIGVHFPSNGVDAGTLFACDYQDDRLYCISNAHVLVPDPSKYPIKYRNLPVYQPSPLDGGTDTDVVGSVYAHMRILPVPRWLRYFPKMWSAFANRYDLGLFIANNVGYEPLYDKPPIGIVFAGDDVGNGYVIKLTADNKPMTFYGYKWGILSSTEKINKGDTVFKVGRTTSQTTGTVVLTSAVIMVDYVSFTALFKDVVMVRPVEPGTPFSRPGDSGSPVWKG